MAEKNEYSKEDQTAISDGSASGSSIPLWRRSIVFSELLIALLAFSAVAWLGIAVQGDASDDVPKRSLGFIVLHVTLINVILALLLLVVRNGFFRLETWICRFTESKIKAAAKSPLALGGFVSEEGTQAIVQLIVLAVRLLRLAAYIFVIGVFVPAACHFYPRTQKLGDTILSYILSPLKTVAISLLEALPDLLTIIIFLLLASYILKFIKLFAVAVSEEQIKISWLPAESVMALYNVLRLVIIVFTFVAVFRRLPGANNTEFKIIAGFVAFIASLSSTSAAGNYIAGLVLTFMRPFKKGDRVRIGDVTGDVIEISLVVTRLVTPKNERVTIPNLSVLSREIVNYSSYAASRGIGIGVEITIGYDVPWQQVHELMLSAAEKTEDVADQPAPFVLQRDLGDFSVRYELVCYTKRARRMLLTRSKLQANILDAFAQGEVEILSPIYNAVRDGNQPALPANSCRAKEQASSS